jgi:hypothetical protein
MLNKKELEMTATESIRATVGRNIQQERERSMYGCTEAELRNSVESSITFKLSGPAMIAASMMSDAQEMMAYEQPGFDTIESQRQLLNRAKWVLFTYILDATK